MRKIVPDDATLLPETASRVFTGEIFDVYQWRQPVFDGSERIFEMVKRADTVQTIAIIDNSILLLDDEQPHVGARLTFPGGRVENDDTDIETAARRETQEETGYAFKNWRLITVAQPLRKMEWFIYTFLAWGVVAQTEVTLDGGEKITPRLVSLSELKKLADQDVFLFPEIRPLMKRIDSIEALMMIPQFTGQQVDR